MRVNHSLFGEIVYHCPDVQWTGRCRLPTFAEYGREANGALEDPNADFRQGAFPLTIQDDEGSGPSPEQESAFRYLTEHEPQVCQIVMTELLARYRSESAGWDWLRQRRSRAARWVAKWVLPPDYKTTDELRPVARCTGVEISAESTLVYAFVAFSFETADNMEVEHGLSVVFHPQKGAIWGDASAI